MSEALIREIAQQIFHEQILLNWKFYLIFMLLILVASCGSAFVASYFKKRGETYATKADFDELLNQLKQTTKSTEEIKIAVSHADWITKEWKTLRRIKLEELMATIYELSQWLSHEHDERLFNGVKNKEISPLWKAKTISDLYFPELSSAMLLLSSTLLAFQSWSIDFQAKNHGVIDPVHLQANVNAMLTEYKMHSDKLSLAITNFASKTPHLMQEIVSA